jgi:potassium-transporting ATPase potassium-binding subunit
MTSFDLTQLCLHFGSLLLFAPLLGMFMFRVFAGKKHPFSFLAPLEKLLYRLSGVNPEAEMSWKHYLAALLIFNSLGILAVLGLQLAQGHLPWNPQKLPQVPFWLALNTAVSFVTNTNWQNYAGEATLSYLTQMLGLTVQNFLSAATGMAVFLALARGILRHQADTLGNFWADVTRMTLYVLLPLAILWGVLLGGQGVIQNLKPYARATTLEKAEQVIPMGPVASQLAIKHLGTNGGGFMGQNAAHPFENPTPFSNYLLMLGQLLVGAASVFMFGRMIKDQRHGWSIFAAMALLFLTAVFVAWYGETQMNPVTGSAAWLEGKELRFGVFNSIYFAISTTVTSCGAVNAMHGSLSPLAGLMALVDMHLGEVVFGGVGAGMYGMILFIILTVFLAGLMVGRTPEYLGKKIEAKEMIWTIIGILVSGVAVLLGTALASVTPSALASLGNAGPHGFSEMLYAYSSAGANNGSAFAGLNGNTNFYNITLAATMLIGRFGVIVPALAVAGSLVKKKYSPPSPGTFPTNNPTFVFTLIAVIVVVGALTFFPSLTLGPIVEHFLMLQGRTF